MFIFHEFLSIFGDPIFWGVVLVFLIAFFNLKNEEFILWKAILAFLILDAVLIIALKLIFATQRPCSSSLNNSDKRLFGPLKYAFPSGHASVAFGILLILIPFYLLWVKGYNNHLKTFLLYTSLFILTVLVCMSRIWLNKHFFVDIVGGIIVGAFVSITIAATLYLK
jgi:membrane-associated phospholipid phosphatase